MSYKSIIAKLLFIFVSIMAASNLFAQVEVPEEFKGMNIEEGFIPSSQKKAGVIHALNGHVLVLHKVTNEAYYGKPGDTIYENDALQTLSGSRCRVMFLNDDLITMAPDTRFSVDSFEDNRKERKKTSVFSMLKGKAMFYALRLLKYREVRFRVKTPTAVVGVRGTKFGAHVYWEQEHKRGDAGVRVADRGRAVGPYLAQTESRGGRSVTIIAAGDGRVAVNNVILNPGDVFNTLTRERSFDPDQKTLNRIEAEAEVTTEKGEENKEGEGSEEGKAGEDTEEGKEEEETVDVTDSGDEASQEAFTEIAEDVSETTQQEIGKETEDTPQGGGISQGKIKGEIGAIAALITKDSATAGMAIFPPMYGTHHDNVFTGGAETYTAYEDGHINNDNYKMIVNELDETNTMARVDFFDAGIGTNLADAVSPKNDFIYFLGGTYLDDQDRDYLKWGYWEDTTGPGEIGFDGASTHYYAANKKIWQIEGLMTHPDYIDHLQTQGASYTYSGGANGVYGDSNLASEIFDLSGSFSSQVDFGTREISQFDIDMSGGGKTVHMSNGSGTIDSDATFDVQGFSGTIGGNNVTAPGTHAGGTFFGYKAEGIAGNWNAHDSGDLWATGVFHGKR